MSKLLPFNAIIEVVSEEHDTAVMNRLVELGYIDRYPHERWSRGNITHNHIGVRNCEGYAFHTSVTSIYRDYKRITLTDLYRDYSDYNPEIKKELE